MAIDDQDSHLHATAPLFQSRFGLGRQDAAVRLVSSPSSSTGAHRPAQTPSLSRNLDHQALTQIARTDAGRIKLLHEIDAPAHQIERRVCVEVLMADRKLPESLNQLFLGNGKIAVFIEVADDELRRLAQA